MNFIEIIILVEVRGYWNNRIHNVTFDEIDPSFGFNPSNDTSNITNLGTLMNHTF